METTKQKSEVNTQNIKGKDCNCITKESHQATKSKRRKEWRGTTKTAVKQLKPDLKYEFVLPHICLLL